MLRALDHVARIMLFLALSLSLSPPFAVGSL